VVLDQEEEEEDEAAVVEASAVALSLFLYEDVVELTSSSAAVPVKLE
jgi:hypothetical protein